MKQMYKLTVVNDWEEMESIGFEIMIGGYKKMCLFVDELVMQGYQVIVEKGEEIEEETNVQHITF